MQVPLALDRFLVFYTALFIVWERLLLNFLLNIEKKLQIIFANNKCGTRLFEIKSFFNPFVGRGKYIYREINSFSSEKNMFNENFH